MTAQVAAPAPHVPVGDKLRYAQALSTSALLPSTYRRQPANLLYAVEYAEMLGMHPLAAVTGVHVIDGKPCASAALIGALVRRAGHRLRVSGDDEVAVAEIVRWDDPDYTFRCEWSRDRAEQAGLMRKGVWRLYPAAMLKARAVTEVARDACEDVLVGLHYTPEELGVDVATSASADVTTSADSPQEAEASTEEMEWLRDWGVRLSAAAAEPAFRHLWEEMLSRHKSGLLSDNGRASAEFAFGEVAHAVLRTESAPAADRKGAVESAEDDDFTASVASLNGQDAAGESW